MEYSRRSRKAKDTSNQKWVFLGGILILTFLMFIRLVYFKESPYVIYDEKLPEGVIPIGITYGGKPLVYGGDNLGIGGENHKFLGLEPEFIKSNNSYILVGDNNYISLFDDNGQQIWEQKFNWTIIDIDLSQKGGVLAITRKGNTESAVLFNRNGDIVWDKEIKGYNIVDSAISQDGQYIALSGLSLNNGEWEGSLTVYKDSENYWSQRISNDYYSYIEFNSENSLLAIGGSSVSLFNDKGRIHWAKKFHGHIVSISPLNNNLFAINTVDQPPGKFSVFAKSNIILLDMSGAQLWEKEIDFITKFLWVFDKQQVIGAGEDEVMSIFPRGIKWRETLTYAPFSSSSFKYLGLYNGESFKILKIGED